MTQKSTALDVASYMTPNPISVNHSISFFDAVTLMYKNGIGNLVVKKNGEPVGLIGERQILHYLVTEKLISDKSMKHIATSLFTKISPNTSILEAAKIRFEKRRKLLVFENKNLVGIITTSDIIRGLRNLGTNPSIENVQASKLYTCSYVDSLFDQIKSMHDNRVGSIIVTKDQKPYGIFTERDLICNLLAIEADMSEEVGRYCSHPLISANEGIKFHEAAAIMADNKIKRLPLTKDGELTKIVCACDLLRAFETT